MLRVEINIVEGDHSVDQKLAFMKKTTEAVVRIPHCPPEDVRVYSGVQARERKSGGPTNEMFPIAEKAVLCREIQLLLRFLVW